jgi:DNA-binding MarR family transcriptional regulator
MLLFEDGTLVSPKTILKAVPGLENGTLQKDLLKLCAAGLLRKVSHGLYQSTSAPEPTEADILAFRRSKRVRVTGSEDERLLAYLEEPREGTDIRFHLRVSRQRVDQKLKLLMDKGLVARKQIDGRRYLYCTDRGRLDVVMAERARHPSHAAKRMLEALPDGPCLLSDLASFCGLGSGAAKDALDELEALGFVQSMRLARWKVITQTTAGKASEYAVRASEKAALSNLSEAFGDHRGDVIELLAILGEATSKELTMAMRGVHPDKGEPGMGQRVQRLRGEGLLVSDTAEANKQPSHKLSEVGEQVWGYIRPFRSPPSRSVVLEHVRLGLEELHSSSGQPGGEWQPKGRAIAIMRVIDAMGSATQREIVELMEDPFENYRSADLALSGLKERGLIDRSGKGTAHHPYKWAMTEYGRERLRLAQTVKLTD